MSRVAADIAFSHMRSLLIALSVCTLAACEHTRSTPPNSPPSNPVSPTPITSCPTPVYNWDLERLADSHSVIVRTRGERPALIVIAGHGTVLYGVKKALPDFGRYLVTGTNACGTSSAPYAFDVVPNPNGSGEGEPISPPAVCTDPRATRPNCDW